MAVKTTWVTTKDVNTRINGNDKTGRGGATGRYIGKRDAEGTYYRLYLQVDDDFTDIKGGRVLSAKLWFTTREEVFEIGSEALLVVNRCVDTWSNDGSDEFHSGGYVNPTCDTTKSYKSRSIPTSPDQKFSIDITPWIAHIAPSSVDVQVGTGWEKGRGHDNRGFRIRTPDESRSALHVEVWSDDSATPSGKRPYVEVEWEPKNTKPDATWGQPTGAAASGTRFTGTYFDAQGQTIKAAQVMVWRVTDDADDDHDHDDHSRYNSDKVTRGTTWPDGQYDLPPPDPVLPKKTSSGALIVYQGTVRVWDSMDAASNWTPLADGHFTVESTTPTVDALSVGTQVTLQNTDFIAPWTFDPTALRISSYRVQFTRRSDSSVWGDPLWDHLFSPTAQETKDGKATFRYGGPGLTGGSGSVGDYTWRIMVTDALGETSLWDQSDFHLSQGQTVPNDPDFSTVYGRVGVTTRLVMRDVDQDHKRRPGAVVAIIEDMGMLAVSANAASPGQMSFSLPNRHPQVSTMEPMRTHWSLQQYRGSQWTELQAGLLTDFDANENDTIFSGLDYLGVLSLSIEAKSQPTNDPEAYWATGGAKYNKKTISYIIKDQIQRGINSTDSPLGFFVIPSGAVDSMIETVTIHSAYVQRLDFIRGLLDSHRGGATGRRSRITASLNPTSLDYEFTVRSNAGVDRPNIRLSYGSLIQAYRVVGLGDWGDKVYGVGRKRNELKPRFMTMTAPNLDLHDWGEIGKAAVWQDIEDETDLQRRARTMATEISRAGKRIALGLRVGSLLPLDGWNICDNVVIDIDDGTVATAGYGTGGWWTIWGWEWRLYPDGHDDLTLVTKPREDISDPVDDLIPSRPVHIQPEWSVGHGRP